MTRIFALAATLVLAAWAPPRGTEAPDVGDDAPRVITVQMVDKGSTQWRFEPSEIQVRPGDVVRFVQTDIASHNVQFKAVPSGAKLGVVVMGPFMIQKGDVYEVEIDERFAPGLYKYVCTPHEPLGMVAQIEVVPGDR